MYVILFKTKTTQSTCSLKRILHSACNWTHTRLQWILCRDRIFYLIFLVSDREDPRRIHRSTFASIKRLSLRNVTKNKKKVKKTRRDEQSTVSFGGVSPSLKIKIANSCLSLVRNMWSFIRGKWYRETCEFRNRRGSLTRPRIKSDWT